MVTNPNMINCGIRKFQIDGRVSLADIMHRHNLRPYQEIEVLITVVKSNERRTRV